MDEPAFSDPWHAQLFALTVHLSDSGQFTWPDWTRRFGATLKRHGLSKELNGGDDYFLAWLETLEAYLKDLEVSDDPEIAEVVNAWRAAYLATPHGHPVALD